MDKTNAIAALAALAQESRPRCDSSVCWCKPGRTEYLAGQIGGERLGLPAATLSFHLTHLKHSGLVTFRREGRSLIPTVRPNTPP